MAEYTAEVHLRHRLATSGCARRGRDRAFRAWKRGSVLDEVVEAGLSEHAGGSGWALFFQRTDYEPDEQDIRWGMNSYCLTTGGGLTVYGGLRRAELDGDVLRLTLSGGAADVLRLAEVVTVRLEVEAGMRQVLGPEGARGLGEGRHHLTRHASGS